MHIMKCKSCISKIKYKFPLSSSDFYLKYMNDKANNISNTAKNTPGKYMYFSAISTAQEIGLIFKVQC
jgi:hypothetical protein